MGLLGGELISFWICVRDQNPVTMDQWLNEELPDTFSLSEVDIWWLPEGASWDDVEEDNQIDPDTNEYIGAVRVFTAEQLSLAAQRKWDTMEKLRKEG